MATRLLRTFRSGRQITYVFSKHFWRSSINQNRLMQSHVTSDSGAVMAQPDVIRFHFAKLLLMFLPFLTLGATVAKSGAEFIEENDIWHPDDDDD